MGGYKNGKVEIFYGDSPPSNLNILWQKRIVTNNVESSELMQYNNNLAIWESLKNTTVQNELDSIQDEIDAINSLNGTNYVMVYGTGTPTENAAELQAAYDEAKTMPRYLGILSGNQSIRKGQTLFSTVADAYGIVLIDATTNVDDFGDNSIIEVITETEAKSVRTTLVVAPGAYSFNSRFLINTDSIDIVSLTSNTDVYIPEGVSINANNVSVSGINTLAATFDVSSMYTNIVLSRIVGPDGSFGGGDGEEFNATAIECTGGQYSFGGDNGLLTGQLQYCKLTAGTYPTVYANGHVVWCINADGSAATNQ